VKKLQQKKDRERILGLLSGGEGRAFFGKGCCENVRTPNGKEKEVWRDFSKVGCQVLLSKEIVLGHPCIPRVRVNKGGDKRPSLRKKGRSWCEGRGGGRGGGTDTRRKGLMQNFM
jgi:hypothetical protein